MANEVWKVGDRISHKSSRPWADEAGERGEDWCVIEARIHKIEGGLAYWTMERVRSVLKMNPHANLDGLIPKTGGFNTMLGHLPWIKRIGEPDPPKPQWIAEFGEAYAVPPEVIEMVTEGELEDNSWHNDTCPSFMSIPTGRYTLWVDHPVREEREMEGLRFAVTLNTYAADSDGSEDKTFYDGDDIGEAIAELRRLMDKEPKNKVADKLMAEFEHKVLDAVFGFSALELTGVKEALNRYREYREANGYQKVPIGLEGIKF